MMVLSNLRNALCHTMRFKFARVSLPSCSESPGTFVLKTALEFCVLNPIMIHNLRQEANPLTDPLRDDGYRSEYQRGDSRSVQ